MTGCSPSCVSKALSCVASQSTQDQMTHTGCHVAQRRSQAAHSGQPVIASLEHTGLHLACEGLTEATCMHRARMTAAARPDRHTRLGSRMCWLRWPAKAGGRPGGWLPARRCSTCSMATARASSLHQRPSVSSARDWQAAPGWQWGMGQACPICAGCSGLKIGRLTA